MYIMGSDMDLVHEKFAKRRILIIGGGISGLMCAKSLQKKGFTNVKILEASDRIGGRLWTEELETKPDGKEVTYLEMGSQRVQQGTSVYKMAEKNNQIIEDVPDYVQALKMFCPFYERTDISVIRTVQLCFARLSLLPENFLDGITLQQQEILELRKDEKMDRILMSYLRGIYTWWYGLAYEYTFQGTQKELLYGYRGLLQLILRKLYPNTVIYHTEVVTIDWSALKNEVLENITKTLKIKVKCRDESTFEADHVIIAIPLGYLKENHKTMFTPPLPARKAYAIQDLTFITINKIFLEFETPFWKSSDVYHVIWNNKMDKVFRNATYELEMNPFEWVKCINRFEYVYTNPNYLCAWIFGTGANIIEKLSDDKIAEGCMLLLNCLKVFESFNDLPHLKRVIKSKWNSNPLFRGSVVYDPCKPIYHLVKNVTETISVDELLTDGLGFLSKRPIILFTGDVGNMDTVSSVEGAIECGKRAADELFLYYKRAAKFCGL